MNPTDHTPLLPGEIEVHDGADLLFRQVHPAFLDNGHPSSQAFKPGSGDGGQLSVRRAPMTPADAYTDHIRQGLATSGTWGVMVSEARESGLRAVDDSSLESRPFAHAYIDFRAIGASQAGRVAKVLARRASARGRLFPLTPGNPGLTATEDDGQVDTLQATSA